MASFGERLKVTREHLGWSIERVSFESKIAPIVIQCIEVNDFSIFASPAYAKGFLRKYCDCLGVDLTAEIDQVVFVGFPEYDTHLHLKCLPETLESSEICKKTPRYQRANRNRETPIFLSGAMVGIFCIAAMFYFMASQSTMPSFGAGGMAENIETEPAFSRDVDSKSSVNPLKVAKKKVLQLAGAQKESKARVLEEKEPKGEGSIDPLSDLDSME